MKDSSYLTVRVLTHIVARYMSIAQAEGWLLLS
jgi:hypothetical protein